MTRDSRDRLVQDEVINFAAGARSDVYLARSLARRLDAELTKCLFACGLFKQPTPAYNEAMRIMMRIMSANQPRIVGVNDRII